MALAFGHGLERSFQVVIDKTFTLGCPTKDWVNINFIIINTSRKTKFAVNKMNRLKVGYNALSNRLSNINGKINLDWLNQSFPCFKIKCKKLFLWNECLSAGNTSAIYPSCETNSVSVKSITEMITKLHLNTRGEQGKGGRGGYGTARKRQRSVVEVEGVTHSGVKSSRHEWGEWWWGSVGADGLGNMPMNKIKVWTTENEHDNTEFG